MTTTKHISLIQPNRCYSFNLGIPVIQRMFPGYMRPTFIQRNHPGISASSTKISGLWVDKSLKHLSITEPILSANETNVPIKYYKTGNESESIANNILGENSIMYCSKKSYKFKAVMADEYNLAHYNCRLITNEDTFVLEANQKMHYMEMNIGEKYIDDYIMNRDLGGGVYLEYHSLPHLHFNPHPQNDGYIILGHLISHNMYELTAFQIPYNKGIYIPPSVVHNDCFLRGNYYVMYDIAPVYSTVLLRTEEDYWRE